MSNSVVVWNRLSYLLSVNILQGTQGVSNEDPSGDF